MTRPLLPRAACLASVLTLAAVLPAGMAFAQVSPAQFSMQSPVGAPSAPPSEGKASGMPSPMACPSDPVDLPPELAAWTSRKPLLAARDTRSLSGARIDPGKAIEGGLRPTSEMRYAQRPEKPGGSVSFGGLYTFSVADAGSYRVALGAAAWVDVVKAGAKAGNGTVMTSTAHGHGPDCSGIRKMVDFTLQPGTYLLQISGNAMDRLPLLVTRLP
ncbi:homogentisate 1,2-dioxygenase [Novosphingobium sp.]|uniref:homogentisate 1,2-dioxygenase n=1 Tax=Novosphingobium sp. TaxID=1874826 RepID=UPI002FE3A4EB